MTFLCVLLAFLYKEPQPRKVYEMRVTGYHVQGKTRGALNEIVVPGRHAAVSPACIELLGEKVYVRGHGVYIVNDLAVSRLDDTFGICTIDLAKGTRQQAKDVGNDVCTIVHIPRR